MNNSFNSSFDSFIENFLPKNDNRLILNPTNSPIIGDFYTVFFQFFNDFVL